MPKVIATINYHDGYLFRAKGVEFDVTDKELETELALKRVRLKDDKAQQQSAQTTGTRDLGADTKESGTQAAAPGSQEYGTRDLQSSQAAARKASTATKPAASTTSNAPTKPAATVTPTPAAPAASTAAKAGKSEGGDSGKQ